jgi:hypothetical protein
MVGFVSKSNRPSFENMQIVENLFSLYKIYIFQKKLL